MLQTSGDYRGCQKAQIFINNLWPETFRLAVNEANEVVEVWSVCRLGCLPFRRLYNLQAIGTLLSFRRQQGYLKINSVIVYKAMHFSKLS